MTVGSGLSKGYRGLRAVFAVAPEPFLISKRSDRRVCGVVEEARHAGDAIVNLGSGGVSFGKAVVNLDIQRFPTTKVVGDACRLPVRCGGVGLIVMQGLVEHVPDPHGLVGECWQALRPGGIVFSEVPFIQPFHPAPSDYQRYTQDGLKQLFGRFECLEVGVHIGPASGIVWCLREGLARVASFGHYDAYRRLSTLIGWIVFPVKYLDLALERLPHTASVASANYILARKPDG